MSLPSVKFNVEDQPDFYKVLRKRVSNYFQENNISKHGNFEMKFKSVFMLSLYFLPLILMITGVVSSLLPVMLMWAIMGFGMSGIGLAIMHDANHGSYSKSRKVNNIMGFMLNFIGGYHLNWKIQHNVLHHTYTNIDGMDEDINKPVMRFSPNQKGKKIYQLQIFYAPLLYGVMTIYWFISKDFEQLVRYKKMNLLAGQGISFRRAVAHVMFNKLWYAGLLIVLPLIFIALAWWQILLGFLMMHFICGLVLAFIFQPAHVVEDTKFYMTGNTGCMENNWAIHQVRTTSNYANNSVVFSWFVGGLNYQIEHHLFPHVCHVHYRKISKIVKATAIEYNLPYNQHKTFFGALRSHFALLNQLGTGSYDKNLAKA